MGEFQTSSISEPTSHHRFLSSPSVFAARCPSRASDLKTTEQTNKDGWLCPGDLRADSAKKDTSESV